MPSASELWRADAEQSPPIGHNSYGGWDAVTRSAQYSRFAASYSSVAGPVTQGPAPVAKTTSLPDNAVARLEYPMADGLLDYFPNALAEVARLSFLATQQHHPDKPMHWDRTKSTDHRNKILRHLVDTDGVDDKNIDHWAMVCWRALAGYQVYLEQKHGLPLSRASRVPA